MFFYSGPFQRGFALCDSQDKEVGAAGRQISDANRETDFQWAEVSKMTASKRSASTLAEKSASHLERKPQREWRC